VIDPRMLPSWVLLVVVVFFGAIVVAVNAFYLQAREREAKERLGRQARALLLPEIQQNVTVAANMQKIVTQEKALTGMLQVAAWRRDERRRSASCGDRWQDIAAKL
jgi:Flp pilus assembly protein TadB